MRIIKTLEWEKISEYCNYPTDIYFFCLMSVHLIVSSLAFSNLSNTVGRGSAQACRSQKTILHKYADVSVELPNVNRNGRQLGSARREK